MATISCCGEKLTCKGHTTTCPFCLSSYNRNGEPSADHEQWMNETEEPLQIIMTPLINDDWK
ncbi:hypothetical protein [Oceanobacillus timonensis]|uniref:hypothetical protein n=1 Tax=Oceanobacillus timonensis TaxID=1926285 RepID=UPI0009BAB845|nr:hypothetical protein [Oceanobacillus timonensis]